MRTQITTDFEKNKTEIWQSEPLAEPEVLFLGTQSMKPMKRRNMSAVYFFSGTGAILMDCAEGTYGQIVDYCENPEQVESVLKKTRVVYITHLHGDHSLGLLRFLEERDKVMKKLPVGERTKIFVLVPDCMMCYVD